MMTLIAREDQERPLNKIQQSFMIFLILCNIEENRNNDQVDVGSLMLE